jgi:Mg-chelatase subunit ChlD
VRQSLPACLLRLAGARCLAVLDQLARDARWGVRLAALDALADLKSPAGVALLVEALEREPGRLAEDVAAHLARLTGRDLGPEPERWRQFLASAPPDFVERADAARLVPARYAAGIRYHDIASASRRFVLVTDLSSSMETREQRRASSVREYAVVQSRLAIAVAEIGRLLSSLDPRHHFDLVTFRDEARAWRPALVAAEPRVLEDAIEELQRWQAGGGTNVQAGLARVFDMAESALDAPVQRPEDLDTVFLLTDGAPTSGELVAPELLLDWVAERNRHLHLRIHCIALAGDAPSRDFLRRLAALTGGQYVERVVGS